MKWVNLMVVASVLAGLAGCSSPPKATLLSPLGPAPGQLAEGRTNGFLQVYSARERTVIDLNAQEFFWNNDFGKNDFLHEPAHTAYTIHTSDGRVYQRVRNSQGRFDEKPALVALPPGRYTVAAEAEDYNDVTFRTVFPVVINSGLTTTAHLDESWTPAAPYDNTQVVWLPSGKIAGWRGDETADVPPSGRGPPP